MLLQYQRVASFLLITRMEKIFQNHLNQQVLNILGHVSFFQLLKPPNPEIQKAFER